MKYEKPELVDLGFSMHVVQGGKNEMTSNDHYDFVTTMAAYEADE
jgi:hypothetical protein